MRDFNKNGKVDGHNRHIYDMSCRKRMEILKRNDFPSSYQSSSNSDHNEQKEIGCLLILLANVVLLMLLEILKSL